MSLGIDAIKYFFKEPAEHIFSLNYVVVDDCLPQICQLHRASTLPPSEQNAMVSFKQYFDAVLGCLTFWFICIKDKKSESFNWYSFHWTEQLSVHMYFIKGKDISSRYTKKSTSD